MKHVLLIYDDPSVWATVPPGDDPKLCEEYGAAARIQWARTGGTVEVRPTVERPQ